jgi:branched-chain amino acid transport system substrate-binding protein
MSITRRKLLVGAAAVGVVASVRPGFAAGKYDEGATDKEIKLGGIHPQSGPASSYGTIGKAIGAYFDKINAEEGGIKGRKIVWVDLDDGYSPPKTVEVARQLVEQEKVLALFNPLGTPPNTAIQKYMNTKKVPQLFVATGASKWGNPKEFPWTMGWQPDYATEGQIYAKFAIANAKDAKIGILYQNDDYGKDYLGGFKKGLGANTSKIVKEVSYEVTDPTVDSQILQLKDSGANVFFNITTPKAAAQAIKKAGEIGWKPMHFLNNVSISVGVVMKPAGLDNSQGIITAQYGKDPTDPQWAGHQAMIEWTAWMKKYYPSGSLADAANVYGYSVAQTMVQVLKQCGDDLTRANVMRQAANLKDLVLPMSLPGIKINTSPTDFYPIQSVQLSRFKGETWELFGDVLSAESA